ncbi:MAG TPA: FAD-binding oxidoreductase [Tahibacter sp.]|nr:FAD-binding oxidoreductase [Tahibacter sp.]
MLVVVARPAVHLALTAYADAAVDEAPPVAGQWRDAGAIDSWPVADVRSLPNDEAEAAAMLAATFDEARRRRIAVSFAGARHSMGGQTAARDGVVVDMTGYRGARYEAATQTVVARAGTRWTDVIAVLEPHGRSVAVMQSNNVFTIGGSVSVNAHGWQPLSPPVAGSVVRVRAVLPDGRVAALSRDENAELFSLALGGYGLFGAILDVELATVPNARYRARRDVVPIAGYADAFAREVAARPSQAGLAFGRIAVTPSHFMEESILTVFRPEDGAPPALEPTTPSTLARLVFRGQVGSDYGKELRWTAEKWIGDRRVRDAVSRNQVFDEGIAGYVNRDPASTDLLQEYFVPRASLTAFVDAARPILRDGGVDLLNITVRDVAEDRDTFLRYADTDMFALVLFFNVPRTAAGDARLAAVGARLADAALALGGRYYLPYRLDARPEQFRRAYPQAERFFALKRRYDPDGVLSNELYRRYGTP